MLFPVVIQRVSERVDALDISRTKVEVLSLRIDTQLRDAHTVTLFGDKGRGSFMNLYKFCYSRFTLPKIKTLVNDQLRNC